MIHFMQKLKIGLLYLDSQGPKPVLDCVYTSFITTQGITICHSHLILNSIIVVYHLVCKYFPICFHIFDAQEKNRFQLVKTFMVQPHVNVFMSSCHVIWSHNKLLGRVCSVLHMRNRQNSSVLHKWQEQNTCVSQISNVAVAACGL